MEISGLVQRRKSSRDRRRVQVFITDDGRQRVSAALKDAIKHEAEVLSDYTRKEAADLKTILRNLLERNGA
jgi:DNA-binding MarR family transcriptional regulator